MLRLEEIYDEMQPGPFGYRAQLEVKHYIDRTVGSSDLVEVLGGESLRLHLRREAATERVGSQSILKPRQDGTFADFQLRWREEFIRDLEHGSPAAIITAHPDYAWDFRSGVRALHEVPGFSRLLSDRYRVDTLIGGWIVYRLNL